MTGTCTNCGRGGGLRGRGLCSPCYQAAWKAGDLPDAPPRSATERPVRDCRCKQARHQHGTRLAYVVDRCRCDACSAANTAAMAELRRVRAAARWDTGRSATPSGLVDAGPAREHLRTLMAAGMGPKTIAERGGVAHGSISAIIYGKSMRDPKRSRPQRKRIRRDLERRILAVRLDLADRALVDATGTRRRLQALVAIGWSQRALAQRAGLTHGSLNKVVLGHARQVFARTARAVVDLYDELWDAPPISDDWRRLAVIKRVKRAAETAGWAPPLAWSDDEIEDPGARPEWGEPAHSFRTIDDLIEDVEWLVGDDATLTVAADRVGLSAKNLRDRLRRAGRDDLADRLGRNERKETAA